MIVEIDPRHAGLLAAFLRDYIRRQERNGVAAPPGLAALLTELSPRNEPAPDPAAGTRKLVAERVRRHRARRRGEDVPLRRPGPQKIVTG